MTRCKKNPGVNCRWYLAVVSLLFSLPVNSMIFLLTLSPLSLQYYMCLSSIGLRLISEEVISCLLCVYFLST